MYQTYSPIPRQLTDADGLVTLTNHYDPWGEMLHCVRQQAGQGSFAWGYFGGFMDAATGLIYVDEEQYYDPQTRRLMLVVWHQAYLLPLLLITLEQKLDWCMLDG